jgi:Mce-associated membrane protein
VVTTRAFFQSRPLLVVSIGLLAIAVVCAGWFGWRWQDSSSAATGGGAGSGGTASTASTASAAQVQQVLEQGERDVQEFNTLSYQNLSQGLSNWQNSSTGTLRNETTSGWSSFAKEVSKLKTISTATILDAALTSLNEHQGTAGIIVALQVTVTPAKGSAATKRSRLEGTLTRTPSGWKLSSLAEVPVGTS